MLPALPAPPDLGESPHAGGDAAVRPAQRWEYLEVAFGATRVWRDSTGREGRLGSTWSAQLQNAYGAQGWELVGVVADDELSWFRLFFKRPR